MKKIYTIVLLTVLALSAAAQDTITFRNGDELRVKVTEVSDYQIKYKLWSNLNGAVFTKNISDIFMIKYEGGHKDVYNQTMPAQQFQAVNNYNNGIMMEVSHGELMLNERELSDAEVKGIFGQAGYETWASARKQRSIGKTWTIIGGAATLAGVVLIFGGAAADEEEVAMVGAIPLFVGMAGLPFGLILNGVGKGRLNWLADQYNRGGVMSQNLSVSFGPSLVCAPSATGNTYGLGAGFQLTF